MHLEHELTKEEIVKLLEAKAKFKLEVAAAGFPQSKWVSNMFELPKVDAYNYTIESTFKFVVGMHLHIFRENLGSVSLSCLHSKCMTC